jgi:hypothetical protein
VVRESFVCLTVLSAQEPIQTRKGEREEKTGRRPILRGAWKAGVNTVEVCIENCLLLLVQDQNGVERIDVDESDDGNESQVEYVSEQLDVKGSAFESFSDVFARFQLPPEEVTVSVNLWSSVER